MDYDPSVVSYEELLRVFRDGHDPERQAWSRQYRNILFYHTDKQKDLAGKFRRRLEAEYGLRVATDIVPYTEFYLAEDYHQKHTLRLYSGLLDEFREMYPTVRGLISSTAAARVNGYLGGNGKCDELEKEIGMFGLSEAGQRSLLVAVCGTVRSAESSSCGGGVEHCPVNTRGEKRQSGE